MKKPKNLKLRNRILSYINAFWGLIIVITGFIMLAAISIEDFPIAFAPALVVVPIAIVIITEVNKLFFRWDKETFIDSGVNIGVCLTAIFIIPLAPNAETAKILVIIVMSLYISLRLSKLAFLEWRGNKKKNNKILLTVLYGILNLICIIYPLIVSKDIDSLVGFYAFYFILEGLVLIFLSMTRGFSIKSFTKVLIKTHTLEILLGLLMTIITASAIFPFIEPNIASFSDGLWYSFAIVTTIGFGDVVAVTFVGRIISVFLGIYGIVVVALFTSVIVNMYNESRSKRDEEIRKDVEEVKEVIKERREEREKAKEEAKSKEVEGDKENV